MSKQQKKVPGLKGLLVFPLFFCHIGLNFLNETVEIIPAGFDFTDQSLIVYNPIPMNQTIPKIEKWL